MALHEEQERRALEGELWRLEQAWREAEEIAAISDNLLLPRGRGRIRRRRRGGAADRHRRHSLTRDFYPLPFRDIASTVVAADMWPNTLARNGTRPAPGRSPAECRGPRPGTPTTSSAGTIDTMLALGTGATVIAARKIASTAAATSPASSGTPYMAARNTSDALWNSALPGTVDRLPRAAAPA